MKTITFNILKPLALTALFFVFAAGLNTASASDVINKAHKADSKSTCHPRQVCSNDNDCGGPEYGLCKRPGYVHHSGTPLCHCRLGNKYQDN